MSAAPRSIVLRLNPIETDSNVEAAVHFLSSRVAEQARRDSIPLSDIELQQLSFSEEIASPEQVASARAFDSATDIDEFELKISKLLSSAFNRDVRHGMRASWDKSLSALAHHDVYILVMVDQAGILRPKPGVRQEIPLGRVFSASIKSWPNVLLGLTTICGFIYFIILRAGRPSPLLGDFADHLIPDQNVRGFLLLFWLGSMVWLWLRTEVR